MTISEAKEIIRDRVSIVDYIGRFVELKRTGSNYIGKCPFHDDKNPSFSVSEDKKLFHCWSANCNKSGDIFTFVQEYDHIDFLEAVKKLAEVAGIEIDDRSNEFSKVELDKQKLYEIYKLVANEYFKILFTDKGKVGREYFEDRNISFETIKSFGLGYASDEYNRIYKFLKEKGYDDDILIKSELFTYKDNGKVYDKFFNRVMFPILNEHNKVIAFGGRVLTKEKVPNKYINSKENLIFKKSNNLFALNKARHSKYDYFILCEGNIDVIMLHQFGFDNAIASLGTGFNEYQAKLIKKYKKQVILSFDMDDAGIKFTLDAIPIFEKEDMKIRILDLSPAKDPDEFLNKYGKDEFNNRIADAKDHILFKINICKRNYDLSKPQEYKDYIMKICEILSNVDLIIRNKYIDIVCSIEKIDRQLLIDTLDDYIKNNKKEIEKIVNNNFDKNNSKQIDNNIVLDKNESLLLKIIINNIDLVDKIKPILNIDDFSDLYCKKIYELLYEGKTQVIKTIKLNTIQNKINDFSDSDDFEQYTKLNNELNNLRKTKEFIHD